MGIKLHAQRPRRAAQCRAMALRAPPCDSIVALIQDLVRLPSRAGEDATGPVLEGVERWFAGHGLPVTPLRGPDGRALGVYAEVQGQLEGRRWTVLDATLDTAGFGDPATWSHPPADPAIVDGWLHGRGSADSKAGAAIFAHLLEDFAARRDRFGGRIGVLLDLDEHSGDFGGARAFFDPPTGAPRRPDGVIIGYPGLDRIVTGSRGYLRARITVHGIAAHSGATRQRGLNAIGRALGLAGAIEAAASVPANQPGGGFGLPPAFTFTGIHGGSRTFGQVPDRCDLGLDIRLTPTFTDTHARQLVGDAITAHDRMQAAAPTSIEWLPGWPAYRVPDSDPMVQALRAAARDVLGSDLPTAVVGPSNIGNYLAQRGVPALAGFGVRHENIHAADERIHLASIDPVYCIFREALHRLHGGPPP
jgi:succinyl-diaminopimelate desuccinylase